MKRLILSLLFTLGACGVTPALAEPVPDAGVTLPDGGGDNGIGTSPSEPADLAGLPPADSAGISAPSIDDISAAAKAGKWLVVVALVVNLLVWGIRKKASWVQAWLAKVTGSSDKGGTLLSLIVAILTVASVQLAAGHLDPWLLLDGLAVGLMGTGNHTAAKQIKAEAAAS